MADVFNFDVFLSHSSKDKALVRAHAERLKANGPRVWLDEWQLKAGDSLLAKIEQGLEQSWALSLVCGVAGWYQQKLGIRAKLLRADRRRKSEILFPYEETLTGMVK